MNKSPLVSIVIPTYNRPLQLTKCLTALTASTYPKNRFEVIVIDDGSPDSLEDTVSMFRELLEIKLIVQQNAGPAYARNKGVEQALGRFIAFTDDDCETSPEWLQNMVNRLTEEPECLYGGWTVNHLENNICATASQSLISYIYEYYNADKKNATFFTSNNLAMSKKMFKKMGGFDTKYMLSAGEDRDFCDRWHQNGYKMALIKDAVVYHSHQMTLIGFWKQHFTYGRGAYCFLQARRARNQGRVEVEPAKFYLNLIKYPFNKNMSMTAFVIMTLLIIAQIANALGFFWEAGVKNIRHAA